MGIEFLKGIFLIVPILLTMKFIVKDFKIKQKDLLNAQKELYAVFIDTNILDFKNDTIFFNGKEIYYRKPKNKFKNREFYEKTLEKIESKVSNSTKIKTEK